MSANEPQAQAPDARLPIVSPLEHHDLLRHNLLLQVILVLACTDSPELERDEPATTPTRDSSKNSEMDLNLGDRIASNTLLLSTANRTGWSDGTRLRMRKSDRRVLLT